MGFVNCAAWAEMCVLYISQGIPQRNRFVQVELATFFLTVRHEGSILQGVQGVSNVNKKSLRELKSRWELCKQLEHTVQEPGR